ncbi:hypothetical protein [Trinickia dinghuensis]|uniref:hypothetical protein n=1 Tax=Trinickia dinghuensis TaxID=2291023 RepID=UPI001FE8D74C|nr:hypothetical protein [Trinickia dinghuensis]
MAGTQRLTTGTSMLSASLAVPTVSPQRYVVNGAIVAGTIPATVQISYSGANVVETYLASDGQTPVETFQGTSYTSVPLAGAIANSPAELLTDTALSVITNTINGQSLYNKQSTWQPNAAYIKETRNYVGDTAFTGDCTAPATTGTSVTPCNSTASTLEGFFPFAMDNKTYNLTDGQIVTLAGARAWVSNAALSTATTEYRVFYQMNGHINSGALVRNGTPIAILPAGGTTPQNFQIFLNGAAAQSIKAAVTF